MYVFNSNLVSNKFLITIDYVSIEKNTLSLWLYKKYRSSIIS